MENAKAAAEYFRSLSFIEGAEVIY